MTALRPVRPVRAAPGLLRITVLLGFSIFCVVPLVWLLLAPTKTDAQLLNEHPLSFGSWDRVTLAWRNLMDYNDGVLLQWLVNSAWYSIASLALTLVTAVLAGYAMATMRFPFRRTLLMTTLVAMVLPATALVLPLFLEINAVGLTNTPASVILPAAFYPFGVYLAFVYYATSLPRELLEAARMDGCGEFRAFLVIAVPLSTPLVGMLTFFSFVANWNNYFLPYVMLSDEAVYNLPVGLGALIGGSPALHPEFGGSFLPITRPEVALAGLVVIVPIAVIFTFAQRYLVRGILSGAVKS